MLRIFKLALEQKADVHPQALQRITRGLPALGNATRMIPKPWRNFWPSSPRDNPERILRLMNESGVLGRFLPISARSSR